MSKTTKRWPQDLEIPESWRTVNIQDHIDRFGVLDNLLSLISPLLTEHAMLRALLQEQFTGPADEPAHLDGHEYRLKASRREYRREITDKGVLKRMLARRGLFDQAWSVAWDFIDRHIEENMQGRFSRRDRTGPRKLTTASLRELPCEDPVLAKALESVASVGVYDITEGEEKQE